jgi:hypothetical protein
VDLRITPVLLISFVTGVILLIIASLGLVIAQEGLPPDNVKPEPIPNNTVVAPNPSPSDSQPNSLQPLPNIPFK